MAINRTLFSDFLTALDVPHTPDYSNAQYMSMPFRSLFGLTKLLEQYGVDSEGYRLDDRNELLSLPTPFLARTGSGFIIVTDIGKAQVSYITEGEPMTIDPEEFKKVCCGTVLLAYPRPDAAEPSYGLHAREQFFNDAKKWVLLAALIFLVAWGAIAGELYRHVSTMLLLLFNFCGLALTFMLVQKTYKVGGSVSERVCGVLEKGGCDDVLSTDASKFFGIFSWSEVGFGYFSVNLLTLLMFPDQIGTLALYNVCCLPYTVWSIWYQRFRAHHWCTLCVGVQTTLWLLFFCNLFGGWIEQAFPLRWSMLLPGAAYVAVVLAVNALSPYIHKPLTTTDNEKA